EPDRLTRFSRAQRSTDRNGRGETTRTSPGELDYAENGSAYREGQRSMAKVNGRHGFSTRAIHAGEGPDPTTNAHNTPIYQTSTFAFETLEAKQIAAESNGHFYTRN